MTSNLIYTSHDYATVDLTIVQTMRDINKLKHRIVSINLWPLYTTILTSVTYQPWILMLLYWEWGKQKSSGVSCLSRAMCSVFRKVSMVKFWNFSNETAPTYFTQRFDSNLEGTTLRNVISSAALIAKPYDALCRLSIKYAMQSPLTHFNNRTSALLLFWFDTDSIGFLTVTGK